MKVNELGLPYARAEYEGGKYYLVCPVCDAHCSMFGQALARSEDFVTKGASEAYAQHYLREHKEEGK
jgi:hypothetical protein